MITNFNRYLAGKVLRRLVNFEAVSEISDRLIIDLRNDLSLFANSFESDDGNFELLLHSSCNNLEDILLSPLGWEHPQETLDVVRSLKSDLQIFLRSEASEEIPFYLSVPSVIHSRQRMEISKDFPNHLILEAIWGGRPDSLETQTVMMWNTFTKLAGYGKFFTNKWGNPQLSVFQPVSDSQSTLREDMLKRYLGEAKGSEYQYAQLRERGKHVPYGFIRAYLGNPMGQSPFHANHVVVTINEIEKNSFSARWLLRIGCQIVIDTVRIWNPDIVSLYSTDLITVESRSNSRPFYGYVTWLSSSVMNPVELPDDVTHEDCDKGLVIRIDPNSGHPIVDATRMNSLVSNARILRPLPSIQNDQR